MTTTPWARTWPFLSAPPDDGAGGAAWAAAAGGAGAAGGGAAAGGADGAGGAGDPGAGGTGGGKAWFETVKFADETSRAALIKAGYHKADGPEAALETVLKAAAAAEAKLGVRPDQLIRVPGAEDKPAEWRAKHAKALGVPEAPEGYEIRRPADLPEAMPWQEDRATAFAKFAHERGWPKDVAQEALFYHLSELKAGFTDASGEAAAALQGLNEALVKEWGGQKDANLQIATRALHHFMAEAGIAPESAERLQTAMMQGGTIQDAQLVKLFYAIGKAMGDDSLAGEVLRGGGRGGQVKSDREVLYPGLESQG